MWVWKLLVANMTVTLLLPVVREPDDGDAHVFQWIGTAKALAEKSTVSARKPSTRIARSSMRLAYHDTATFVPRNNLRIIFRLSIRCISMARKRRVNCQGFRHT